MDIYFPNADLAIVMTSIYLYIARCFKNSVKNDQKTNYNYVKWSRQVLLLHLEALYFIVCHSTRLCMLFADCGFEMWHLTWLEGMLFVDEQIKTRSNFKYDWHVHASLKRFLFNINMTDLFLYYTSQCITFKYYIYHHSIWNRE